MRDLKIFGTAFVVCAIALGVLASICHATCPIDPFEFELEFSGQANVAMSLDVAAWSCGETGGGCHGCELEKPTDLPVAATTWAAAKSLYR